MRISWALVALCVASLLGAAGLVNAPRSAAQTPGVYIAVGDSIAAGIGSSLPRDRSYPSLTQKLIARHSGAFVPFENLAEPGETARTFIDDGQLARFRDAVSRARDGGLGINAVTVSLGGNEMLDLEALGLPDREEGLSAFRANFAEALTAIRSVIGPEVPLIVTTYYDLTEGNATFLNTDAWWIEQFNAVIREQAQTHEAAVADIYERFVGHIEEWTLYPVDVHPDNDGHEAIAATIWQTLGIDTGAPEIVAPERIAATRDTPTLLFNATDSTSPVTISLECPDVQCFQPLEIENGEFIALIDISDLMEDEATIAIVASDPAGNVTRTEIIITRD